MAYEKLTWGTYQYDDTKSFAENIAAAKVANALVTTDKIKHIEQGIADKAEKGEKGEPGTNGKDGVKGETGAPGKDGTTGPAGKDGTNGKDGVAGPKGADGKNGSDAKQIKSGVINEDKSGIVTGITVTFTDNTTIDFFVNKTTE